MLDNFGLGEFFLLAMLALLFFGPDRLPQIGARIGRWVANLTQYSKAFMTEWREEALVIHEAVEEVRGIRDEIAAARAEISNTLETAREDVTEGIDTAKEAISGAQTDVTQRIQQQRREATADLEQAAREESSSALPDSSGEGAAIAKTRQILEDLQTKRDAAAPATHNEDSAADKGRQETQNIVQTGLKPKKAAQEGTEPEQAKEGASLPDEAPIEKAGRSEMPRAAAPNAAQDFEEENEEQARSKGFAPDRTRLAPDDLVTRRGRDKEEELATTGAEDALSSTSQPRGAPVGPITRSPAETLAVQDTPSEPKETAFDRTQQILDDLKKRRRAKVSEQTDPAEMVSTSLPSEFERLCAQVLHLEDEMKALRQELQVLRTWTAPGTASAPQEQTHTSSDEQPIEEAA
jgi:Sec-independent protein translocase protein TatA